MEITRQADYAIRAVLYLSENEKMGRAPTNVIAEAKHIPPSFLAKIVSQLSVAGLVSTSRGARGGVTLARPSGDITLLEVIEAIDGPLSINQCALDLSVCQFGKECLVGPVWCKIQEDLVARLREITFNQLVNERQAVPAAVA
jgi:Rrf2 family protein